MIQCLIANNRVVPVLIVAGGVASAVGSSLLFWNPSSYCGFSILMLASWIQIAAGLIWYRQPAKWG